MPKIYLKSKSPEFADDEKDRKPHARGCDMPGCQSEADHRAPKDRSLSDYYWFCFDHVQEYNKAWDFFSGMSQQDIENHIVRSALWDRDTFRFDNYANLEDHLKRAAWQNYHFTDKEPPSSQNKKTENNQEQYEMNIRSDAPEFEAMAIMGLAPPLDIKIIKARYKELAKKHHPDVNRDNPESEELLKRINMAYTILKLAYEQFAKLPDRK